jgi:hypothetical protein
MVNIELQPNRVIHISFLVDHNKLKNPDIKVCLIQYIGEISRVGVGV